MKVSFHDLCCVDAELLVGSPAWLVGSVVCFPPCANSPSWLARWLSSTPLGVASNCLLLQFWYVVCGADGVDAVYSPCPITGAQ